jgi:hypothetical protein
MRIECSCIKTRNGRPPQLAGPSGSFAILRAMRRASSLVSSFAADRRPSSSYNRYTRGKTMNWFSRKTSISGVQVPNYWMLVLVAVVVIWIIYSFVAY